MEPTEIPFEPDLKPEQLSNELHRLYEVKGTRKANLSYWPDDWTSPKDPLGFLQWYEKFSTGQRSDTDAQMIKRWHNFKQRHLPQFVNSPTARRAISLRNWAIDPLKYVPEDKRKSLELDIIGSNLKKEASDPSALPTVAFSMPKQRPVPARPKPLAMAQPTANTDWKTKYRKFLWDQENASKTGYSNGQWKTYDDRGHPAVGPGLRVPSHGVYTESQINGMLDESVADHYERARAAVEAKHGAGAFSRLTPQQQWGLTDFYYNGVAAPKLAEAMLRGDTAAMQREHVRYTTKGDAKIPLTRRNEAWWSTFGPATEKSGAVRLGAGVLFKQEDGSYLLQYETDGPVKGKLRPAGGGKDETDINLRATIVRELGEEFGLEPEFIEPRLTLLGFIREGKFSDCALYEMVDHGLKPATYQASNDPDEKVTLVEADLGDDRYIGVLPGELRQPRDPQECDAAWPLEVEDVPVKEAASLEPPARTGSMALVQALKGLDLDALEAKALADIKSGKVTRRGPAVKILNVIQGLRRNNLRPEEMMVRAVPVVPPEFRPYAIAGDTFLPGDANELLRDLFEHKRIYNETRELLGESSAGEARLALYDAQKALYGFGEPASHKLRARGVSGFLKKVVGPGSPKFSWVQRKMLSKPQDNVGRGTIIVDPDLGLDEVGIPKDMAWVAYAPHIQRRLVRRGMSPGDALKNIEGRTDLAFRMLQDEIPERPVIYSRAPAWHKFSVLAGVPRLIDGDAIAVNPYVTAGLGADFDGDQINFHVPALDDSVEEARERLFPSKMLFSIRSPDKVMPVPKHESLLGLYSAQRRPALKKWVVPDKESALKGIERGDIDYADEIEINPNAK